MSRTTFKNDYDAYMAVPLVRPAARQRTPPKAVSTIPASKLFSPNALPTTQPRRISSQPQRHRHQADLRRLPTTVPQAPSLAVLSAAFLV